MNKVKLDNARDPEQLRRMKEAQENGECYFCKIIKKETPVFINSSWFVKKNDFPYEGTVHHFLLVSNKHITEIDKLSPLENTELFDAVREIKKKLNLPGFSLFVRSGDMAYTSATLDHLHFHLISGERKTHNERNKLDELILAPIGYKKKQ